MALAHFRMLIHELLNEDPDMVPKEAPLVVLDSKSAMCMAKNGKDTKNTRHIASIIHLVRNGEKTKMHKIDWCEVGLPTADLLHTNQFCASWFFLHSLQNVLYLQCVWYFWCPYHS